MLHALRGASDWSAQLGPVGCNLCSLAWCCPAAASLRRPPSTFVLLDGTQQTTQDLRGKVVLVNFWATSCVTCVAEMPELVSNLREVPQPAVTKPWPWP
jgi:thiol-disulfide isomerase/thioredoxin